MSFDFDTVVPRHGTNASKWEFHKGDHWDRTRPEQGDNQVLPMWVADMDFQCAPAIREALAKRAEHGIYGYTKATDEYFETVKAWFQRRQGWEMKPEWIVPIPGVVTTLNLCVRTFVTPGKKVIIQQPVYHPFPKVVENNGAQVVNNGLVYENGRYGMDFDDLAAKAADPDVEMLILCSPHNPVSRVWSPDELQRLAQICLENDVLLVADELHGDLIYSDARFTTVASLGEEVLQNSIICTAPSKAFNLAGLHLSNIAVPDPDRRARLLQTVMSTGLYGMNPFSMDAVIAAYGQSEDWLDACIAYFEANYRFMAEALAERVPQVSLVKPEGTYMVWMDCRRLGLSDEALEDLMLNKCGLYLNEGYTFGPGGSGFERFNLACPRSIVERAVDRLDREINVL